MADASGVQPAREIAWRQRLERGREWAGQRLQRGQEWFDERSRRMQAAILAAGILLASGLVIGAAGWSDEVLALTGEVVFRVDPLPTVAPPDERTLVLDVEGREIGVLTGPENRISVPLEELPDHIWQAVIATEDQSFMSHEGISMTGITRAAVANVLSRGVSQGGSTITQQYVKNALLTSERSLSRKITEATWAVRLEQRWSKQEIMQGYLDIVYLGEGTYGVGAASNYWLGKDARELTLADSALLAGMIRAPESTHPVKEPELATGRRDLVLDQMVAMGAISPTEADEAKSVALESQLHITPLEQPETANGLILEYVKQRLLDDPNLGRTRDARSAAVFGGGLTVTTTLNLDLVQLAERTLAEHLSDPLTEPMGGIVSIEPATGAIRAMALGPHGFGTCDSEAACTTTTVNPLVPGMGSAGRQVGSAFKPLVVAAALEAGIPTSWHTRVDSGSSIEGCGDYRPENYDHSGGMRDMPAALTESNNVFHVKLGVFTGLEDIVELAGDLGITNDLAPECSLPLGTAEVHPIEMAAAYATFANGGVHCAPAIVQQLDDRAGRRIATLEPDCDRVLDEEVAATVTTMLRDVIDHGTARRASIGRPAAAKTGTTDENLDAWLVGFTPELATATWVGFEIPEPMNDILGYRSISGGTLPAVLWAEFMSVALEGVDPSELPSVHLTRYSGPDCPAPAPDPTPAPGPAVPPAPTIVPTDGEGGGEPEGEAADGVAVVSRLQDAPSEDDGGHVVSDVDGDSFESGHQPQPCAGGGTPTPAPTASESASPSPSETATDEPSPTPSGSSTPSPTPSPSQSPSPTPTATPTPTPTESEPKPKPTKTDDGG